MIVKCGKCGKRIKIAKNSKPKQKYFCSRSCANSRTNSGPKPDLSWKVERVCLSCGKKYVPNRKNQKWCRSGCGGRNNKHRNEETTLDFLKRNISIDESTGCWIWKGRINRKSGFGIFRRQYVHTFVFRMVQPALGKHPSVKHKCLTKLCCNPAHMQASFYIETREPYNGFKVYGPYLRKDGRQEILLYKDDVGKTISYPKFLVEVHTGAQVPEDKEVHHRDLNPLNNSISNLVALGKTRHRLEHQKIKLAGVA